MDDAEPIISILLAGLRALGVERAEAERQAQSLYGRVAQDYAAAGQPYGASHDGMMFWLMRDQPIDLRHVSAA